MAAVPRCEFDVVGWCVFVLCVFLLGRVRNRFRLDLVFVCVWGVGGGGGDVGVVI